MAAIIPIPDLKVRVENNTCCTNNRSASVIYNDQTNEFHPINKRVTLACCICGNSNKERHRKTWEVLGQSLQHHYGVDLAQAAAAVNIDLNRHGKKSMSVSHFETLVGWAKQSVRRSPSSLTPVDEEPSIVEEPLYQEATHEEIIRMYVQEVAEQVGLTDKQAETLIGLLTVRAEQKQLVDYRREHIHELAEVYANLIRQSGLDLGA